jgi:hypothetical protein
MKKKGVDYMGENLPEAPRTDMWMKTSNGGSLGSKE